MAIKSLSIRIDEDMLDKLHVVADYEGRSANGQINVLIRDCIAAYEKEHGKTELGKGHKKEPPGGGSFFCAAMSGDDGDAAGGLAVLVGGDGAAQHLGDVLHHDLVHGDAQIVVGGGVDEAVVGVAAAGHKVVGGGSKSLPPTDWMVTRLMDLGAK